MCYGALFDMDGVLVDSAKFHILAFEEWCREKGLPFDREYFVKNLFGQQNRDIFRYLLGREQSVEEYEHEDTYKEIIYRRVYAGKVEPLDGLVDFLKSLKDAGVRIAVATSGPISNVEFVLGEIGITGLFDAVVTSEDIPRGKPDPGVFLLAAEKLGLPADRCVVFEDSVAGAQAAGAAGSVLIGVTTGREDLPGAARMIPDFCRITAEEVTGIIDECSCAVHAG